MNKRFDQKQDLHCAVRCARADRGLGLLVGREKMSVSRDLQQWSELCFSPPLIVKLSQTERLTRIQEELFPKQLWRSESKWLKEWILMNLEIHHMVLPSRKELVAPASKNAVSRQPWACQEPTLLQRGHPGHNLPILPMDWIQWDDWDKGRKTKPFHFSKDKLMDHVVSRMMALKVSTC